MSWLMRLKGYKSSNTALNSANGVIDVRCSASANQALTQRTQPLFMEVELAFGCVARKQVYFHDSSSSNNVLHVNEKLSLLITNRIPATCDVSDNKVSNRVISRTFMPKWVSVDFSKGQWHGEYGL